MFAQKTLIKEVMVMPTLQSPQMDQLKAQILRSSPTIQEQFLQLS